VWPKFQLRVCGDGLDMLRPAMNGDAKSGKLRVVRFPLADLEEQVQAFAARWPGACADRAGLTFAGGSAAHLRVPLLAPRPVRGESVLDYARRLPGQVGTHVVLLLQAGAMALGCWEGDTLLQHKAVRRYVVRGNGKAQSLHQKTRGKSRYGSRLRLQNWKRLLHETSERLAACLAEHGPVDRIFVAAPVRVLPELYATDPAPPFRRDDPRVQRVPMHVHRPDFAELLRVQRWLGHGRLQLPND
jgi:hypothetical protein